jgi:hypothetical protein
MTLRFARIKPGPEGVGSDPAVPAVATPIISKEDVQRFRQKKPTGSSII